MSKIVGYIRILIGQAIQEKDKLLFQNMRDILCTQALNILQSGLRPYGCRFPTVNYILSKINLNLNLGV